MEHRDLGKSMPSGHMPCALKRMLAFEESNCCQHTAVRCWEQGSLPEKIGKDSIQIAQNYLGVYYNDVILLLSILQKSALSKGAQNVCLGVFFCTFNLKYVQVKK